MRARDGDLTREYDADKEATEDAIRGERISGKGDLSRKRTIAAEITEDEQGEHLQLAVDETNCLKGRVLSVHGLSSHVRLENGRLLKCATRRLLKTLSTDQRNVVAAGDHVLVRKANETEGIIERIEPRYGCLSRTSRGRQHVIVANVDQLLVIMSAAEPDIKPHLIDRMLVSAEKSRIRPLVCVNKVDLVAPADLQPAGRCLWSTWLPSPLAIRRDGPRGRPFA